MTIRRPSAQRVPPEDRLLSQLRSLDPRDRKAALQSICETLETGTQVFPQANLEFAQLIAQQRNSTDPTIRRWFYKYVGLSHQDAYIPTLLSRVLHEDEQTAAWMIGALGALIGVEPARTQLRELGVREELVKDCQLFTSYFLPKLIDRSLVQHLTAGESDLLDRWAAFLNSRAKDAQLEEYARGSTRSTDTELAEFSVWSTGKTEGFAGTRLTPDEIPGLPSQVRRWAYRTLAADVEARVAYADLLWTARQHETDERVREALALGLGSRSLPTPWRDFMADWRSVEGSVRVRTAIDDALMGATPTDIKPERVFRRQATATRTKRKGQATMFGAPTIEADSKQTVYLLALDTVSFSESSDDNQLRTVNAFLSYLARDPELLRMPPDSLIPLFTGDGIILGIVGAEYARVPLDVALRLQADFRDLYRFEVRIGVHCGAAFVLDMSNGTRQLLGHAVNQASRVMAGAAGGSTLISSSFFDEVLHGGRERVSGFIFSEEVVYDKHGHRIDCYSVTAAPA